MEQTIQDKAPKPAGLIPKNLQPFLIVGLALLMVIIMAITGHKQPATVSVPEKTSALPNLVPVNSQKVNDFQKDIEQTQKESAPQVEAALLEQQKRLAATTRPAQPYPSNPYGIPIPASNSSGAYPLGAYAATPPQNAESQPSPDPIKDEQKKRAYLSLFSDNVAVSYRKDSRNAEPMSAASQAAKPNPQTHLPDSLATPDPSVAQAAAELASEGQLFAQIQQGKSLPQSTALLAGMPTTFSPQTPVAQQVGPDKGTATDEVYKPGIASSYEGKQYVLFEGTVFETLLINRLDGSFSGPIGCLISNDVYSHDRQHLLIPAGSKIFGQVNKADTFGQSRLAVVFHRIIMPDGYSVNLDRFKGLDQEGATALQDRVNNHYARIFGATIAIGVLGGVAQSGTGNVLDSTATDRMREGFGSSVANAGEHILDRFLNIVPTVTIREGTRVKVYLSNDLLLPDYTTHTMPSNL